MHISEIFHSIQGEGALAGTPSVFVRTAGCNLRCTWCDTPHTSWHPEGRELSVDQIRDQVTRFASRYVVLTGGEPTIAAGITELAMCLQAAGRHVTLETAATVIADVPSDLASISPKLANSTPHERDGGMWAARHESARIDLDAIRHYMNAPDHQLKFVIERETDLQDVDSLLNQIGAYDPSRVFLMPEGVTEQALSARAGWLVGACMDRGFRFCPRWHIHLFGNRRGT